MKTLKLYPIQETVAKGIVNRLNKNNVYSPRLRLGIGKSIIMMRVAQLIAPKEVTIIVSRAIEHNYTQLFKEYGIVNVKLLCINTEYKISLLY